uniref:Uncharacterized protein n=1 Tax=Heterosigma akashiwo TaxID=2829 RepID=A0A6V1R4D4_HETAK
MYNACVSTHTAGVSGERAGGSTPPSPPRTSAPPRHQSTLLRQFPSHMPPPAAPWDQRHPQPLLPHQQPWGAPSPGAAPPPPRPSPSPPAARGGRFASPLHSQRFSPHQQGPSPAAYSPVTLGSPDLQRQQQRTPSPLSRQPYYSNAMQPHTGQQGNSLQQQRVVAVQAPPHHQQALQQIHRQLLSQQQPRTQQQQLYTQPTFQGGVMQQSTLPHQQTHTGPHQHQHGAKNWPGASYQQRQHQQRFH